MNGGISPFFRKRPSIWRFGRVSFFFFLLKNGVVRFIFFSKKVKQYSFSFKKKDLQEEYCLVFFSFPFLFPYRVL